MIPTQDELKDKAEKMNAYLQSKYPDDNNKIIERIEHLSVMIAQSGELLAGAKWHRDNVTKSSVVEVLREEFEKKLTPTALNKYIGALAKEENYLANIFDRINSAAVHQMDGLRSILSYRKAEFSALNYSR
jgi:hypothetical protein